MVRQTRRATRWAQRASGRAAVPPSAVKSRRPRAARPTRRAPRRTARPESSGSNSTESARVAEQPLDPRVVGVAGVAHEQLVLAELAPGLVLGELLARDQHDVLAARALEVQVEVRLRVGVEVRTRSRQNSR